MMIHLAKNLVAIFGSLCISASAIAQDQIAQAPPPAKSEWSFAVTPYGWAIGAYGNVTAKGMRANVSANIIDLLGSTNSLYGFMGNVEARKREYSLYLDAVYTYMAGAGGVSVTRTPFPSVNVRANANANLSNQMAIVEGGFGYQLWSSNGAASDGGAPSREWTSAIDAIAGFRYWHVKNDVSVGVNVNVSVAAPGIAFDASRNFAIASTGSLDWVDPFIGLRLRQNLAPQHEIVLQGDVGGFGVGSQIAWQARLNYAYQFSAGGTSWSALIGYRALGVTYVNGAGDGMDMILAGPVIGLTAKF
jgi:hypothetical protein